MAEQRGTRLHSAAVRAFAMAGGDFLPHALAQYHDAKVLRAHGSFVNVHKRCNDSSNPVAPRVPLLLRLGLLLGLVLGLGLGSGSGLGLGLGFGLGVRVRVRCSSG